MNVAANPLSVFRMLIMAISRNYFNSLWYAPLFYLIINDEANVRVSNNAKYVTFTPKDVHVVTLT